MQNKKKSHAILHAKCPRCREGAIFKHPLSKLPKFIEMHEHCPHCGLRYMIEPGFFYGAMYISYAFSVAIVLSIGFATYILGNDPPLWVYLVGVTIGLLLALPFSFRYSRVLMLHLFSGVKYNPNVKPLENSSH